MTTQITATDAPAFTHTRECRTWALGMAIHARLAAPDYPPGSTTMMNTPARARVEEFLRQWAIHQSRTRGDLIYGVTFDRNLDYRAELFASDLHEILDEDRVTCAAPVALADTVRLAWVENYADGLQESGVCSCAQLALVHAEEELRLARKAAKSWQLKWPADEIHSASLAHRVKQLTARRNAIKKEL